MDKKKPFGQKQVAIFGKNVEIYKLFFQFNSLLCNIIKLKY